jgi:2-polyprenyl-6-methoxyphenol hydroxylase-like FAD-dependent oxidoreductase
MPAVSNVLVIGAGAAGTAAAIFLADNGVTVDLAEAKPTVTALGSGITVQGNALRVLRQLGVYDQVRSRGYAFNTLGMRLPDEAGTLVGEMEDVRSGGPDLPATIGMYRPDLAQILIDRAVAAGAKLRLGTSATGLAQDADGVNVTFSDGSTGRYDLVVGADGIHSWTRRAIGIGTGPAPVGMGIWRVFAKRPASVVRTDLIFGGRCYIAGYCPTGQDTLYAYLVEDYQDRSGLSAEEGLAVMRELAGSYHGPWDDIRQHMTDPSRVNYTSFDSHIVPGPWNRGRVVLIGDAAHSCPPNLAQGAAQALEDAAVLAELVLAREALEDVWPDFMARRYDRAKTVVDSCVQLCQWLLARERGDVPAVMGRVFSLIAQPA